MVYNKEYANRKLVELQNSELIELKEELQTATSSEDILNIFNMLTENFTKYHCQPGRNMLAKLLRATLMKDQKKAVSEIIMELNNFLMRSQHL